MKPLALAVTVVLLLVAAAACGGSDGAKSAGPAPSVPVEAEAPAAPAATPAAVAGVPEVDYVLDLDTGVTTALPEAIVRSRGPLSGPSQYAVSSDGSRLAYAGRDDRGVLQIFVASIDGTDVRQVTHDPRPGAWSPAWSPDGTKIAYRSGSPRELAVLDVASGDSAQISNVVFTPYDRDKNFNGPQFTPDGSSLLYAGTDGLRTVPVTGGKSTLLIGPDGGLDDAGSGSLSPDGSLVTYMASGEPLSPEGSRLTYQGEPVGHCGACRFVANADNTDKRVLRWCLSSPAGTWSPDSSRIVCTDWEEGFVYVIDIATGTAKPVAVGSVGSQAIWLDNHTLLVDVLEVGSTPSSASSEPPEAELPAESAGDGSAEAAPDYSEDDAWICRPGRDDVCAGSLDITMVSADGSTEVVEVPHAADAPVDCLYVYPTVSQDKMANSDLVPGEDEELAATLIQAARFGSVCDVYVPVYRQITLAALFGEVSAEPDFEIPYGDVLAAFRHYLANDGAGRGFVLIGHSQGADLVSRLIREDIAGVPALRERLVSAMILGPPSADVLPDIPPCIAQGQVGCLVSYATYDAASPPPGIFGAGPALCTNPAALGGGSAPLHPAFVLGPQAIVGGAGGIPFADATGAPEITTAWVGYPDFVTGECVDDGSFGYLSVTIHTDPADARTDDLAGDALPDIGLHHLDSNIAVDDLVAVVAAQAQTFAG